jgi:Ion transport protein/Cyclic nucleotide-binding domain
MDEYSKQISSRIISFIRKGKNLDEMARSTLAQKRWMKVKNLMSLEFIIQVSHIAAEEKNASEFNSRFFSNQNEKKEINVPWYIILPENKLKSLFDLVIAIIYFYFAFSIPFRISFYDNETNKKLVLFDTVFEVFILIDIILTFFCAYYQNSVIITDLKSIAKRYLRKRFIWDLIAVPPFYLLDKGFYWLKISRLLRISLLITWVENSAITKNFINDVLLKDQYTKDQVFKLYNFVQVVMITCHCIACIWYYITTLEADSSQTWLMGATYPVADLYIRSLYWTAVTFSSVGYGDITPKNDWEYVYAMFIEFVGIMFFAYLMGNVSTYLTNFQLKEESANEKENELNKWLLMMDGFRSDKTMPPGLTEKIREFFYGTWSRDNSYVRSSEFMKKLPYSIREELKEFLFSDVVQKFSIFFEGMSKHLIYTLASIMKHKWTKAFETLIQKGQKSINIYFINSGSVMVGKSEIGYVTKLLSGSYFGEYSLFKKPSEFDFTAMIESSIFYFPISEFKTWMKNCEFNYYSFAQLSFKRNIYFRKEFAKSYNTDADNIIYEKENDDMDEELDPDEEQEFYELLEKIKEPEPTGCTAEEKEQLLKKITQQARKIQKLQKMYETDIKKIIHAVDLMNNGKSKIAFEILTEE